MYDPQLGRFHTIDPLLGLTLSVTPYHYCLNNPIIYIDPTGMYTIYDLDGNPHEIGDDDVKDGRLDADHQNNSTSSGSGFDAFSGIKTAWDNFWAISAREDLKNAKNGEEASNAAERIDQSNADMKQAQETIETVNEILIATGLTLTGYGVLSEGGGFLLSRIYVASSDFAQQLIITGDISEVDIANSIIAGIGGNKAVSELAKTLVDWKPGDALPTIKTDITSIGVEYGLRLTLSKVVSENTGNPTIAFGVQLVRKGVRNQIQDPIIQSVKSRNSLLKRE